MPRPKGISWRELPVQVRQRRGCQAGVDFGCCGTGRGGVLSSVSASPIMPLNGSRDGHGKVRRESGQATGDGGLRCLAWQEWTARSEDRLRMQEQGWRAPVDHRRRYTCAPLEPLLPRAPHMEAGGGQRRGEQTPHHTTPHDRIDQTLAAACRRATSVAGSPSWDWNHPHPVHHPAADREPQQATDGGCHGCPRRRRGFGLSVLLVLLLLRLLPLPCTLGCFAASLTASVA